MQRIKEKIKSLYIPINTGSLALFISILAIGYVASATNTPCLNAQSTCAIGDTNEFSNEIAINSANYKGTLSATNNTSNQTYTFPNATGTIALTSDIPSVPTLTASKIMATDGTGAYSTTDIYPLSVGTTGQVLTVNSGATALEYSSITGVPSLTASKSVATDGAGALTTTNVYPLTLTASTPLKTNVSGEVTASDLDITTDITPGTALQEIRVNSGGTALEYYTPSGGSPDSRIVAQGSTVASSTYTGMEMICWYGQHTLDKTKNYKLIFNGGGYNVALSGDSNYWRPQQGDCTSGGGSYFSNILNYWLVGNGNLFAGNTYSTSSTYCRLVQSTNSNTSSAKTSNLSGEITLRPWRATNGYGFFANYDAMGVVYNALNSPDQIQSAVGGCQDFNTNSFADITGLDMQLEGNGTSSGRGWVLYEYYY